MKHIACVSGGKDSVATVILAHRHNETLDEIVFSEVMFDRETSGELPEHIDFVKNKLFPLFENWGYKAKILHSNETYIDCFYKVNRGKKVPQRKGMYYGFPMSGRCIINRAVKIKPIQNYLKSYNEKFVEYVGIAIDEPKRLERLKDTNKISLLEKYCFTEQMAYDLCKEYGLLSPIYSFTKRGGCWFCPNARLNELKHLRTNYPDLWNKLLELEEVPNTIGHCWNTLTKTSIHNIEERLKNEEAQMTIFDFIN